MAATCLYCGGRIGFFGKKLYLYPGNKKGSLSIGEEKISCKKCFEKKFPPTDKQKKKLILQNFVEVRSLLNKGEGIKNITGRDFFIVKNFDEVRSLFDKEEHEEAQNFDKVRPLSDKEKRKDAPAFIEFCCMDQEEHKKALKKLEDYADKKSPEYWHYKGVIFLKMHKYSNALKCFEEALFLDSRSVVSWHRRGLAFLGSVMGKDSGKDAFESAIKCFENVMALQPRKELFRDNFHMAAKYCRMLTLILFNHYLKEKNQFSPHINKMMHDAFLDIYPFLTDEVLINQATAKVLEYLTGDLGLAAEDFEEKCIYRFQDLVSFLEPIKYYHPLLGERH